MTRIYRSVTVLLALLLVLAACGTQETPTTPPASGGPGDSPTAASEAPTTASGTDKQYVVGVIKQTTHPALDAAQKGIEDAFAQPGLNVQVDAQNANNDAATMTSIIDGFRDKKVDLVVAIGTLPAQAAFQGLKDSGIPIVFNTVTDPYAAGVAQDENTHPGITGIQALPPVTDAFDLILAIKPDVKKVGNIWTSSEKNSEVATGLARAHAEEKGIEFIERTITKADEVQAAAEALAGEKVDAIFISTDSTVVSALEAVVKVANDNGILLVCNDPASAKRGCTAALGLDYYDNGVLSVNEFAIPILKGDSKVDALPIQKQKKQNIAINQAAAQMQGATVPQSLLDRADPDKVYDSITPKQ